ncbi:MAG: DUF2007 domain-containing protein [Tannerella sp.]|jgi:hypothetical protein|nr:DUF2007 domain-containing protein [Tannerella sp.]
MEDKMVEIARFHQSADAEMLANLLQSEGVDCYVRDGISSRVMFGSVDLGGAKVELLQKDVPRASGIMRDHGYDVPDELPETVGFEELEQNRVYRENKARLSKALTVIIILIVALFGLLIYLNKYFNGQ